MHVLLRSDEGVVVNVDPAPVGKIDVGNCEQDQRDEEGEGKDLESVKTGVS